MDGNARTNRGLSHYRASVDKVLHSALFFSRLFHVHLIKQIHFNSKCLFSSNSVM